MNKLDIDFITNLKIPKGSHLGLNYSHMHDTSIAIVSPNLEILFCASYERFSRVKMDGRFPSDLLEHLPLDNFSSISLPYYQFTPKDTTIESKFHLQKRNKYLEKIESFPKEYFNNIDRVGLPIKWSGHQTSHATLAFALSKFKEAVVLTYDGGAYNCPWFGGVYLANLTSLKTLDLFPSKTLAKVTTLYTFITAVLGFTPVKHEGKVTGLAALGSYNEKCLLLLNDWFKNDFDDIEKCFVWRNLFEGEKKPFLWVRKNKIKKYLELLKGFSKEDIAFAVQHITEEHVLKIVALIKKAHPNLPLCLAGGLFANVKLNQKIKELDDLNLFVAPPMGDDGLALGAILFQNLTSLSTKSFTTKQMYLGPLYSQQDTINFLTFHNAIFQQMVDPKNIAELLKQNKTVAIFTGAMEFGPRALCNRTILANPDKPEINITLNNKLHRTEFMPFAPVMTEKNIKKHFQYHDSAKPCLPFMTITMTCKDSFKKLAPAVVHVDNTARPQMITEGHIVEKILFEFENITGIPALINTSFNVHEEPIVCNAEDALKGFLKAKIDYLYIENCLLEYNQNSHLLVKFESTPKAKVDPTEELHEYLEDSLIKLEEKEKEINFLTKELNKRQFEIEEKEKMINKQNDHNRELEKNIEELLAYKGHIENHPLYKIFKKIKKK